MTPYVWPYDPEFERWSAHQDFLDTKRKPRDLVLAHVDDVTLDVAKNRRPPHTKRKVLVICLLVLILITLL